MTASSKKSSIANSDKKDAMIRARTPQKLKVSRKFWKIIGPFDLQIAGQALANKLILVTNNEKEFSRIKDLKIEN